ncbi:energy transducer TonB [Tardibacter chloracetimidivorans]|uniref:Energy transducer TonB n=2 Tax=Tardibacter chloracetimidivorans TaxID=1921510 RepID=A0A1L3ZRT9_9SPHN|nr:energy transducer TonB [Tardibacter chloracetimidivorans]API58343.1 energy transducer TonB [Tardibacter chloracetimidivorans]
MAYADQQMSTRRIVSIGIVALLHAALGYAFVTGLAYNVIKQVPTVLETFDVQEAKPPEEEPPPPPPEPEAAPPPVAPPPEVVVQTAAPPPPVVVAVPRPPVISAPPPPPVVQRPSQASPPSPRGRRAEWITTDDYPGSAQRAGEEGTTGIRVQVNADGRVESCTVTQSSGSSTLDDATCRLYSRRGRFTPAKDTEGNAIPATYNDRIRWQIPD